MILAVLNQKGGVGKTTIALHLAHGLILRDIRTIVIDADPQGSARDWAAARTNEQRVPVMGMDRPVLHKDLPGIAADYEHVIIDGPPRATELVRSALLAADHVLIPVQPSPYDVWACQQLIALINEASVFKENLNSVFVINRKIVNTVIGDAVREALAAYNLPVLASVISQRIAFAESASVGATVWETDPQGKAVEEMEHLIDELLEVCK